MILSNFEESNIVFDKPPSMTVDECEPACAWKGRSADGQPLIITCWKMTLEEREEFLRTGRIWCFHFGNQLQPHALDIKHPFK